MHAMLNDSPFEYGCKDFNADVIPLFPSSVTQYSTVRGW